MSDPYAILEVSPRASFPVIKAAYRALMVENHPDHKGNDERAKQINAAYALLSDDKKRAEYDAARYAHGRALLKVAREQREAGYAACVARLRAEAARHSAAAGCAMMDGNEESRAQHAGAAWELNEAADALESER